MVGIIRTAFTAALLLLGPTVVANALNPDQVSQVTIRNNRGGHLLKFALRAKQLARDNRRVRISGRCSSACTMYLTMPSDLTCITSRASFGFHLPYGASREDNAVAAKYMIRSYPQWVRQWIASKNGLNHSMKTMPYSYASQYMKTCE